MNNTISLCIPCEEPTPVLLPEEGLCPVCTTVVDKVVEPVPVVYTKIYCYTRFVVNQATQKRCNPVITCTSKEFTK